MFVHNVGGCFQLRTLELPSPVTISISYKCYANTTEGSFFHLAHEQGQIRDFYHFLYMFPADTDVCYRLTPPRSFIASVAPGSLLSDSPAFSINIKARRFILDYWQRQPKKSHLSCEASQAVSHFSLSQLNQMIKMTHVRVKCQTVLVSDLPF